MGDGRRSKAESDFRASGRWLWILLGLVLPVTLIGTKLSRMLRTDLVFGLLETILMAGFLFVCIWRLLTYCRWTGKYPFYWLRRK